MNANELQGRLETYLAVRSALGYKDSALKLLLRDFVKYVIALHDGGPIRAQVAVNWVRTASASCGAAGQACRLSAARGFLSHLRASIPETEVPAKGLVASAHRRLPYIFSQEMIATHKDLARKLDELERKYDQKFAVVFDAIRR